MLHQWENTALGDLGVMVQAHARGFLRNIGPEARFGFQPIVVIAAMNGAVLHVQMVGIVANLGLGWLRRDRRKRGWLRGIFGDHSEVSFSLYAQEVDVPEANQPGLRRCPPTLARPSFSSLR